LPRGAALKVPYPPYSIFGISAFPLIREKAAGRTKLTVPHIELIKRHSIFICAVDSLLPAVPAGSVITKSGLRRTRF